VEDELIFNNFQKHISLCHLEKQKLKSALLERQMGRKEIALHQGQICRKIYFVQSGSLRAFYINEDGKEFTIMFAVCDWWITDMNCFANQNPAMLTIESLEESQVLELDFHRLEELYKEIPKLERFFRIIFQKAYIREQLRALHNISYSTIERYQQFVENYPAIVQKATQKQIASYLGVTPEFLSTVKKKK